MQLDEAKYIELIEGKLSNPLFNQGMVNNHNYHALNLLSTNYSRINTINVGWLSIFRSYNSSETLQNRTALDNKRTDRMRIFDIDGENIVDWSGIEIDANNNPNLSDSHFTLALDTENVAKKDSPVFLLLLSNQHIINDYLSNNAHLEIAKMGITLAIMEYPGYGVSLGRGSRASWLKGTCDAVCFLNTLTSKKIYILGQSIGGPLALEAATMPVIREMVSGAISYGGFTNLYDQSKNQLNNLFMKLISKPIVWITSRHDNIDGISGLDILAKNGIGALVLHGEKDGAVTPKNLYKYQERMDDLQVTYPDAILETTLFANLFHEEVNNYNTQAHSDFYKVWNRILQFVQKTSP